ncbi:methyltransferase TYW3-domain-containing protein [Daldinia caldariorum]|uniref:methyltransferase TYW3-domain-containing protein n=1 Tax=Daldinia caldariorum TaxID=326644 RepID=UPI00200848F8|nr:methyltransferase TYW3-domain-containing protein [Daldinia caldariorum]KAI1472580.1 methyltransferase TYW3-domain-containing protein [Daldinia caldariorum]
MKGDNDTSLPTPGFARRKARILEQLGRPEGEYTDASPKGTVDEGVRELIGEVNGLEGFVTTSSCAGRVSVFLEGSKKVGTGTAAAAAAEEEEGEGEGGDRGGEGGEARKLAGVGGKGGGGNWLFVSHDPVLVPESEGDVMEMLGLKKGGSGEGGGGEVEGRFHGKDGDAVQDIASARLVHFKFEPMILHVLTASPEHAQLLLRCGLQAGFRESGAVSLTPAAGEQHATPIVAIRSMGLTFESLIGYQSDGDEIHCTVSSAYLRMLVRIANERFVENTKRINRFRAALAEATKPVDDDGKNGWEDAQVRRERKRAEGLKRKEELRKQKQGEDSDSGAVEDSTLEVPLDVDFT